VTLLDSIKQTRRRAEQLSIAELDQLHHQLARPVS